MPKSKVYSSPTKRQRRLGIRILVKSDKYISKRPYPPGQQGLKRKQKLSDYGLQLLEKQKAKFIYQVREKQFKNIYNQAKKTKSATGEKLLQLLELRLDNIIYRGGLVSTRRQARQLVTHGHIKLNEKKATIPSMVLKKNDIIDCSQIKSDSSSSEEPVNWLKTDKKSKQINTEPPD